ncbi:alpha/beta fold hydrolase [Photobacterium frigidiphilum]|uniref:thioesterase II family protein n=1 Tax=Photobacterium frigidiphilum TaxID=264736 RepID=UPI003D14D698
MNNNRCSFHGMSSVPLPQTVSPWLKCFVPRPKAQLRLICLPHAGGGASAYASWARLLPESVELWALQLPGREDRLAEPMIDNMATLVTILVPLVVQFSDKPYAFFGHSMGAALGYELCLAIFRLKQPLPQRLLVSGREAPVRSRHDSLHLASDSALIDELLRLEPTMVTLFAHKEFASMALPVIRNDYAMINGYHPRQNEPLLPVVVTGMTGEDDPELLPGDMNAWQAVTEHNYILYTFPGRHFYLREHRDEVLACIGRLLTETVYVE